MGNDLGDKQKRLLELVAQILADPPVRPVRQPDRPLLTIPVSRVRAESTRKRA